MLISFSLFIVYIEFSGEIDEINAIRNTDLDDFILLPGL